jgi:L-fuconolactonase
MDAHAAEAVIEPDLPIVDPHHHLWDRRAGGPRAHAFDEILHRYPRYLLDDLLADTADGHRVMATVFVECRAMYRAAAPEPLQPVGEVEFVNGVAAMSASRAYGPTRAAAAIVGKADLLLGDAVAPVLEALAAASGRFRGIRHSASADPDAAVLGPLARTPAGLYRADAFRAGFARLAERGLTFDAWLLEPQLPDLIDLARAFPEQPIVLDHLGTPLGIASYAGRRDERFGAWRDSIRGLAGCPAVAVKLGGLAMPFCGFDPPPPDRVASAWWAEQWRPYIETCIEAFGPERCMFESNFPVDKIGCDYRTLWNAFKRLAAGCSATEKAALFAGTARRFYRIEEEFA